MAGTQRRGSRGASWTILSELERISYESQTNLFLDADIIETDGGVIIFLPGRLRLRSILLEWAQGMIGNFHIKAGCKLDPNNLTKRETGRKAMSEEAAEIENEVKKDLANKVFRHSLELWREHLPQRMDDAVLEALELVHLRAFLDWMNEEGAQTNSEAHYLINYSKR